ncbi:MAG TPA: hypothetical protein VKE74_36315, partial [Gemmataceae bacterium]|nr:hypothetical protein [Gemmataceae bacterium]
MTHRAAVLVAVLLLGATPASGQPLGGLEPAALRGDSTQTRKRLAEARNKLLLGKHADATDELQRILDESGDDLIPIDDPRANHPHQQYRPARWVAHHILTMLPPDALRAYQDRIDEPARKLLEAGRRDRDPRPLWQLLDRYFVSRPAQEGLLLLGDLLFERGQFRTAEQLWRRLLPRTADRWWERLLVEDPDIPYPTPAADPAAVRARVALAVIFQGEADRARQELVRLAALHPGARGPFAGGDGPYAEALEAFLVRPPRFLPDAGAAKGDWPTFAGGPGRTGRAPGRMPSLWPDGPTWRMPLFSDGPTPSGPTILGRQPFGHPVILDGKVYVTDGTRVRAFDL